MITLVIALVIYFVFYSLDMWSTLALLVYMQLLAPHTDGVELNPHMEGILLERKQLKNTVKQIAKVTLMITFPGILIYYLLSEMAGVCWIIFNAGAHYAAMLMNAFQVHQLNTNPQLKAMIEKVKTLPPLKGPQFVGCSMPEAPRNAP